MVKSVNRLWVREFFLWYQEFILEHQLDGVKSMAGHLRWPLHGAGVVSPFPGISWGGGCLVISATT